MKYREMRRLYGVNDEVLEGQWGPHLIHDIFHEQILGLLPLQYLGFYVL